MTITLHCFGAASPSGQALRQLSSLNVVGYSRNPSISSSWLNAADMNEPSSFCPAGSPSSLAIWISFAPIWLLAPFMEELAANYPDRLQNLRGVVACSSSSCITKRFAANRFDRNLVDSLTKAEDQLHAVCQRMSLPCQILRPTMIYGQIGTYGDRNLSLILQQLRRFSVLPLPADSGFRQPIHASQLAAVVLHFSQQFIDSNFTPHLTKPVDLGGDTTLTYLEMVRSLQKNQPDSDPAHSCRLLLVPNRVFFLLAAPLLLSSPKAFEAVLRMGANLSGFTPAHKLLGSEPQSFPVMPLV